MADDNKTIPPSAGEAAKEIASDDKNEINNQIQSIEPKSYESVKPVMAESSEKKSGNVGWKVSAIIFALIAIGASCACVMMLMKKDGDRADRAQCEAVAEGETKADDVEQKTTPEIAGDNVVKFNLSGPKLNLGDGFEFINYAYSASPSFEDRWKERISVGGLSTNIYGAQNIPDFSRGRYEFSTGTQDEIRTQWVPLMNLDLYEKAVWDTNIQPQIDDALANGGPNMWGDVVYSDDSYVVVYSHQQNVFSTTDWEKQWEMDTITALESVAKESSNWSK